MTVATLGAYVWQPPIYAIGVQANSVDQALRLEDPDDFDKAAQDIKDLRAIIDVNKGLIVDGNWRPKGEDAEY